MAEQITRAEYEQKFGSQPIKITREEYNRKFMDDLVGEQDSSYSGREFRGVDETVDRISTAYNEPATEGVPDILKPTVSVLEGAADFTLGAGAGVNDVLSSLADLLGADTVAAMLKQGADDLRSKQFKPKSEGGIMADAGQMSGEEAVYTTGGGAAGSAANKLFGNVIPAVNRKITSSIMNRGGIVDKAQKAATSGLTDEGAAVVKHYAGITPKPQNISVVSELIGKVSPSAQRAVDKYYTAIASVISDTARANLYRQAVKELNALGFSDEAAGKLLSDGITANRISKQMIKNSLGTKQLDLTKPAAATGALFGVSNEQ